MLGEVAELFGLTARAVRYYEGLGLIHPRRDESNRRLFDPAHRRRLQLIALLRAANVPLKDVGEVLRAFDDGHGRAHALELLRNRSKALQTELAGLKGLEKQVAELPDS